MYIAVVAGIAVLGLGLLLLLMQQQHARISTHANISADRIAWTRRSGRLVRKVQLDRM